MRDDWNTYFLKIAQMVSARSTCDRLHVGCVLVHASSKSIIATGYNGSAKGSPHCDDVGHDIVNNHCVRTVHAECNAIAQAATVGVSVDRCHAFLTAYPCWKCASMMINAGVWRIVYASAYRIDERVQAAADKAHISLEHHPLPDVEPAR